jgi:two-component system NtrC family sensor kinase
MLFQLNHFSNKWGISKKILYNYTVAISISFLGTTSGLLIGKFYEKSAYKQLNLAYQQQSLLKDLENKVTRIRLHPQRIASVLQDSVWLEFEQNKFLNEINQFRTNLSELKIFTQSHPNDLVVDYQDFEKLLNNYLKTTESYNRLIQNYWQQIATSKLKLYQPELQRQQLLFFINQDKISQLNIEFEKLSDELIKIIGNAELQQQQAQLGFTHAQNLRLIIVFASTITSTIIAAFLALYTGNLIVHPLQVVTNVAQKITQESNFQIRANINTEDEVGKLATSINQLVDWVENYTLELKLALTELKEAQTQLIQTEKMSSLGRMVGGIAHEINNPVTFIYSNMDCASEYICDLLDLLKVYEENYPEPNLSIKEKIEEIGLEFIKEDLLKLLASLKSGAQRIREIVLSLRNFSRLDEAEVKQVDIHQGIESTLLILNYRLNQGIEVIKNYGHLPLIECYPAQINQVFINLLINAVDALLEYPKQLHKQITIATSRLDENHIRICIRDNGPGIPVEIQDKVFDHFFTTKPIGKGTGLGLSISYQIVEKHKGKIELSSKVNLGTELNITLPIHL